MEKTYKQDHESQDDVDFAIPEFESEEELESWWRSLPSIDLEFDERLGQRIDVLLRVNQRIVEGFRYLAKQKGLQHGEDLMKIVLMQYLANHLPKDF